MGCLAAGLLCWIWAGSSGPSHGRIPRRVVASWVALALVATLLLVGYLNPAYVETVDAEGRAGFARADWIAWLPTCVDAHRAGTLGLLTFSGLLAATLASTVMVRRASLRLVLHGVFWSVVAQAILGSFVRLSGGDRLLWVFEPVNPSFFGAFRYHNHWGAYALLGLGCGLVLLRESRDRHGGWIGARNPSVFYAVSLALVALSILLSSARASLLGLVLMVSFLWLWPLFRRSLGAGDLDVYRRRRHWQRLALACVAVGGVLWMAWVLNGQTWSQRWQQTLFEWAAWTEHGVPVSRWRAAEITVEIIRQRPVWGWGWGSFAHVFAAFAAPLGFFPSGYGRMEFAHNDWLQGMADLGVAGFLIFCLPMAIWIWRASRSPSPARGPLLAAVGVVALMAWVDFPLSNPAVFAHTVVLLAVAARYGEVAPSRLRRVGG